jgi:chromosome segregation ATPase
MQNTAVLLLVVGLVIGGIAGYGGGFFGLQSTITQLQSRVDKLESDLSDTNTQLSQAQSELSKTQTDLNTAKTEISNTEKELSGLQNLLNASIQLTELTNSITYTESEITDKISSAGDALSTLDISRVKSALSEARSLIGEHSQFIARATPIAERLASEAPNQDQREAYADTLRILKSSARAGLALEAMVNGLEKLINSLEIFQRVNSLTPEARELLNMSIDAFEEAKKLLDEAAQIEPKLRTAATRAQLGQLIDLVRTIGAQ